MTMSDESSGTNGPATPGPGDNDSIDLTKFDDAFAQAPVEENRFAPLPDGKYVVEVEEVKVTRSKDDKEAISWKFRIVGPKYANRRLWRLTVLEGDGVRHAKADLYTAGLKLTKLSELPRRVHELVGRRLEVTVRTKHERGKVFNNVYINHLLPTPDGAAPRGETSVGELGMF